MKLRPICLTLSMAFGLSCAQAAIAAPNTAATTTAVNDNFVLLQGGTFTMGSPETERQRQADETAHEVTLSPFYVDPYEVTQEDYAAVMGKNPSHFTGDNLPVEGVTWYDAIAYCNALSQSHGLTPVYTIDGTTVTWDRHANGYRLLTEAEWEYAARAGTTSVFTKGGQIVSDDANFCGTYPYLIEENYVNPHDDSVVTSSYRGETIPVDSLSPNAFGLYNMEGNVSEWVFDYYGAYDTANTVDPAGPNSGALRVNRGGGWNDFAKQLRNAYRSATTPDTVEQNLGFRIARNAASAEQSAAAASAGSGSGSGADAAAVATAATATDSFTTTYTLSSISMPQQPKVLVAYFSHTGNTRNGAEMMAEDLGADLFEIKTATPYRGNIYEVTQRELNSDARPALVSQVENMAQYDVIVLGYPTWWSTMPMPLYTFLSEYDFSGKIILPFSSHGSTRFGDSISDLSKQVPNAYVGQGFEFYYSGGGDLEEQLEAWLQAHGLHVASN